jgi:hypothetical protein
MTRRLLSVGMFETRRRAVSADSRTLAAPVSDGVIVGLLWVAGTVWIWFILQLGIGLTHQVPMGLTFNEMLTQLLHGRFDVDPATIGREAFQRGGRSYAYFGIFCALLRAPLILFGVVRSFDMTGPSLLVAASVSLAFRLAAVANVFSYAKPAPSLPYFRNIVLLAVAFSGETVQFLYPNIYQESVSWGDALAAAFVFVLVSVVLGGRRRRGRAYVAMAALAGLALLCRVSFGVGLYAALGLMIAVELWSALRRIDPPSLAMRRIAPAVLVLAIFAGIAGWVNFERWGDPLSFIPMRLQTLNLAAYPDRLPRLERYGEFNLIRVPFALQYYFAPIWELTRQGGHLLFEPFQLRLFEDVELPPGSFFLSDPLVCLLGLAGVRSLLTRRGVLAEAALARAALIGLAIPTVLILSAIGLTFRYRMDFYPMLDFAAWLGLAVIVMRERAVWEGRLASIAAVVLVGVLVAHVSMFAYRILPFGPATDFDFSRGVLGVYESQLAGKKVIHKHIVPDER